MYLYWKNQNQKIKMIEILKRYQKSEQKVLKNSQIKNILRISETISKNYTTINIEKLTQNIYIIEYEQEILLQEKQPFRLSFRRVLMLLVQDDAEYNQIRFIFLTKKYTLYTKMFEDTQAKNCKEVLRKNNLNPIKKLGKGGFGLVYLVSKTDFTTYETQLFSVKCTNKKNFIKKPVLRRYLKQQILLLQSLHHPNIVKLIRTFEDDGWIFMVMEYCNIGNLTFVQNQKNNRIFPFDECKSIISDVIDGLTFMHKKKIIHRDIKPENILLMRNQSQNDQVMMTKICDLGFSREAEEEAETFCGTTYYMAPEIFNKKKYNHSVDIWALGVLIFSMLYGHHPFKGVNMINEFNSKCDKGFDIDAVKKLNNATISSTNKKMLKQLFRDIFKLDPEQRISLEEIKERLYSSRSANHTFQKKSSQKQTIASQSSSEEESVQFYLQEIQFVQNVWTEVQRLKFLSPLEELALKYYLDKVCLSLLNLNSNSTEVSEKYFDISQRLRKSQTMDSVNLASNISKVGINKFSEVFSSNTSTDFKSYKEAYRLVVGHAFYKAHKMIINSSLKHKIKLKLFCCHVINRVFDKSYVHELFKYYYEWLEKKNKPMMMNLNYFEEWIEEGEEKDIVETVELINNRFYKKNK